jgi:predicted anti-sigma-YlaC factor YlaD
MSRLILIVLALAVLTTGCIRKFAINRLGDALAKSGTTFASDDDPDLIQGAVPFSLKLIESLLAESPRHRGLLFAASSDFTQYAYAFVNQDADEMEAQDLDKAMALRARARRLYLRARDYGLRGLEVRYRDFGKALRADPTAAAARTRVSAVPLLIWTNASRGFAIRSFLVTSESSRLSGKGDFTERSRAHFERAMEQSGGNVASPLVALAETVSVHKQDRKEFQALLDQALAIDVNSKPEWRLNNLVTQRRARWLLGRADQLFVE